jgi:hypothetical protein
MLRQPFAPPTALIYKFVALCTAQIRTAYRGTACNVGGHGIVVFARGTID